MQPERQQSTLLTNNFMKKYQLTGRETEIICKIAEGLTTKDIAAQLFLSEFTINTHRRNICRKLNIYTPVGLLNFAKEHGLVS
jgi:DNA-binding NarL/FixJ family response regulator